jgi:hypothetical protein
VLTLDHSDRILIGEDVLIEDERTVRVGGRLDERDGPFDRVIDAGGRLVMPGLVNAHFHCYDRFLRGMWEGMPLEMWILSASPIFQPIVDPHALCLRAPAGGGGVRGWGRDGLGTGARGRGARALMSTTRTSGLPRSGLRRQKPALEPSVPSLERCAEELPAGATV